MSTNKQRRAQRMNFLKFRRMSNKNILVGIQNCNDLPEEVKKLASYMRNNIREMIKVWPKHIGEQE